MWYGLDHLALIVLCTFYTTEQSSVLADISAPSMVFRYYVRSTIETVQNTEPTRSATDSRPRGVGWSLFSAQDAFNRRNGER